MDVATDPLEQARQRETDAWAATAPLIDRAQEASVERIRLELLAIADRHPGLTEFELELEYAYDDEGGYFATVNKRAEVDENAPGEKAALDEHGDPEEELDYLDVPAEVLDRLTGDDQGGKVTPAQLREAVA